MNELETTYKLVKSIMGVKEELVTWARLSREDKISDYHEKRMMKHALEMDELLRDIGVDWIKDYEANKKIKSNLEK